MFKKIKIWLYNHLHLRHAFKKNKATKSFIILTESRSGSTLLKNMLNQLNGVHCDGELFNMSVYGKSLFPYYHIRAYMNNQQAETYGFKLFHYQLSRQYKMKNTQQFIDRLYNEGFQIIYLRRENMIDQVLSINLAMENQQYHSNTKVEQKKYRANVKEFIEQLKRRSEFREEEAQILKGKEYLPLVYEKDLMNYHAQLKTLNKVCDFLSVSPTKINIKMKKLNQKKSLKDKIENYEEFEKEINKTEYKKFLY